MKQSAVSGQQEAEQHSPSALRYPLFAVLYALLLTACAAPTPVSLPPTATRAPAATATPTPVWFPPTETPTPVTLPEPSPSPEMRPGIGDLLLTDDFADSAPWLTGQSSKGTVSLGGGELTIALVQPRAYLFSTRTEPTFSDFYAEITASPSLCEGLDEYGLLFRMHSLGDFYRFSLSCNGQVRLDRVVSGAAGSPQPWMASASVPPGAPSSSRLGIWAVGSELRFFINDTFQFAVNDRYHASGLVGVFARSAGENAVTISFSELRVYQVEP
jgi:hypothetical protein